MSQLCVSQKQLSDRILKLYSNTKKTSKSRYTRGYLETRLDTLTEYWNTYNKQHEEILKKVTSDVLEQVKFDPVANFDETEEVYLDFKTLIKECMSTLSRDESKQSSTHETCSSENSEEKVTRKTKLPPISIPKFSGIYTEWFSYRDIFTSLIHNDEKLSNIEKHHYLKSSITGEAEQLLKHFTLTAANYEKAWETLVNRYDNKRIIVSHILNRLLNQRKMTTECAIGLKGILDTTRECLNSLENIGIETNKWDAIITHIVVSKLDMESHKLWEQSLGSSRDIPAFDNLASHLECRYRAMEAVNSTRKEPLKRDHLKPSTPHNVKHTAVKTLVTEIDTNCTFCSQSHYICHCKDFANQDVTHRREFVKNNKLCFNCLVKGHTVQNCRQGTTCRKCGRRHHTLLHINSAQTSINTEHHEPQREAVSLKTETQHAQVILATARVVVLSKSGATHELRALVDPGSQASFVTESTAQLLNLDRIVVNGKITGISNETVVTTKSMVKLLFHSVYDHSHTFSTEAYVLKRLTSLLPTHEASIDSWPLLSKLKLADPQFYTPGCIDILLGAEVHSQLMVDGLHRHNSMIALNSHLGWLISGQIGNYKSQAHHVVVSHTKLEIDQLLRRFWELEEHTPKERAMTQLETRCEEHYKDTHTRSTEGRYIVCLPFKSDANLGDTKQLAHNRLLQMEKKFKYKPEFKEEYCKFLKQYEEQGHMELVPEREINKNNRYYLPHHAVLKESSISTKLRVVFDGSAKPTHGNSLNDELMIGPPLQQDIKDLVTRWRSHRVCLVADIQQMYRQILTSPCDNDYQRILWRENVNDNIKEYRLLTVTYGTACAPYLAIRTLHQLSVDEKDEFPLATPLLKTDFYMDDLMSGTSTVEDTINLQQQITQLLDRGGFALHKWASNSAQVLSQIPNANVSTHNVVNIQMNDAIKALGISWNPQSDNFELKMSIDPLVASTICKRTVLSIIAKTFDPLGWLAPIVIVLKIFMQKLWLAGLEWDDGLPEDLNNEWCTYHENIINMNVIQLPRWLGLLPANSHIELHGFCDASCAAYACVAYLRVFTDDVVTIRLIAAKSKVAPVKQVSLPRLELCGAVLLAKLLNDIKTSIPIEDNNIYAWTDSTIVLAWLRKHPNSWTTFVANRTTEILNFTHSSQWHHIRSPENPADLASRGMSPNDLEKATLWWEGPLFLRTNTKIVCQTDNLPDTVLESKPKLKSHVTTDNDNFCYLHLNRYSSLTKLIRVTAYCLRFVQICKTKARKLPTNCTSYLCADELLTARYVCIRLSQHVTFQHEINLLSQNKPITKTSRLYSLNVYLDIHSILRVGGRLANVQGSLDFKSPVLLSSQCNFTKLVVIDAHHKTLHGGFQLTLNVLNTKYYVIGAKRLIKSIIRKCIPCFRQSASPRAPFMGNLPSYRVKPARPFLSAGVDFAGPFSLKLYSGRCTRTNKAYISLFVCTVTKAIHLELVENLSTMAFMAAFKRFSSRRGHCKDIYSDCGTNFQGASKELAIAFKTSQTDLIHEIAELLANDNTTWHFIPPGAPHFGGLWEAGVKSVKGHLKRVIGQSCLTFTEFYTLLTQVEACVNSRPLTLIDSSLNEPPITPGHFLIGEAPIIVPDENFENARPTYLNRWQMVQRMLQSLWRRWQSEYLTTLQHRYKWNQPQPDIHIGTIVLVKDERLPPGKWLMGRVVDKHPGKDGVTRVVSIQFKDNIFKRPVTKLCPLPIEADVRES